jgi:hypothetical protein
VVDKSFNMQPFLHWNTEDVTLNELTKFLAKLRNNETSRKDLIHLELMMYASQEFIFRFLRFLNNMWDGEKSTETGKKQL